MIINSDCIIEPPKRRSFFPKIFRSIMKKFFRFEWFIRANLNYYLRIFFKHNSFKLNKICILLPSKSRPGKLDRLLNSLIEKTKHKNRIKILVLLDENENKKNEYEKIKKNYNSQELFVEYYFKDFGSHSERETYLVNMHPDEDLYFHSGDDSVFILKNWDTYLDFIESKTDRNIPYSIWTRSNVIHEKYHYLHSDFPIVNNLWIKKIGYFGARFKHNYTKINIPNFEDLWICELGRLTKQFIITKKFILDHVNAFFPGNSQEWDETAEIRKKDKKIDYFLVWKQTENYRKDDAKKLLN